MALEKIRPRVVDETGNYTFNNVTATGNLVTLNANLGNVATANYIKTDNLQYANGVSWPIGGAVTASGSNTYVQFNNAGSLGSSANFVFDSSTNRLTVTNITANGAALTNLTGANVIGTVGNANYAAYAGNITLAAQGNITSLGTLTSLSVTGNISSGNANLGNLVIANYYSGSGNNLSNIQGSNVTGAVSYATTANTVAGGNVSGAVTYAATANAVAGGNVMGTVANATYALTAGTATTATTANAVALANVSGAGNVASLNKDGSASNVLYGNGVFAPISVSAGSQILNGTSNVSVASSGNITMGVDGTANVVVISNSGNYITTPGNVKANYFIGNGSQLTGIDTLTVSGADIANRIANGTSNIDTPISGGNITVGIGGTANTAIFTTSGITANRFTGNLFLSLAGTTNSAIVSANMADNDQFRIYVGGTSTNNGFLEIATGDDGNEPIYFRQYSTTNFGTIARTLTLLDASGDTSMPGKLTVTGNVSGNILVSTVAIGTAPLAVTSTTKVTNLNADLLDGYDTATANTANTVAVRTTTGNIAANYFVGNGYYLTGIDTLSVSGADVANRIANGTSNIDTPTSGGNITVGIGGTSNTVIFTSTGVNVAGYISPSTGSGTNGIIWPSNPGGGTLDVASIKYYVVTGEQTRLEINVQNDIPGASQDDIYFTTNSYVVVNNATEATSTSSAPFQVLGGAGIAKKLYVGGNIEAGTNYIKGNGYYLTGVDQLAAGSADVANSIANGTSNINTPTSGGNITVGIGGTGNTVIFTSTGVNVAGTLNVGGNVIVGNLTVNGTTTTVNSTTTRVVDPIFELGGGANGAALSADDNKDRGILLHYHTGTTARDAFIGWDDSNSEFGVGSNVSLTSEVVTWNSYGNLRANFLLGNGYYLTGIDQLAAGSADQANYISNGTSNINTPISGGNITVGIGGTSNTVIFTSTGVNVAGYATVVGNITGGNANLGNAVTANYFIGNGALLTGVDTLTVGTAGFADGANYIANGTSNVNTPIANGNITVSIGGVANTVVFTSTGMNVTGNITTAGSGGNLSGANYVIANYFSGSGNNLSNIQGANVSGAVSYATTANAVAGANVSGAVSYATTANSVAVANVSGIGNIATINKDGNSSNVLYGNGVFASAGSVSVASLANGTSNVNIAASGGNITMGVAGNAGIITVTGTGVNIAGYANLGSGNLLTTGNITGGNLIGPHANGNSNVNIPSSNGNVTISAVGNANIVIVTGTGVNIAGYVNLGSGNLTTTGNILATKVGNSSTILVGDGANITGIAASTAISLINGNSNVVVAPNSNVTISVTSTANVVTVTSTGVNVAGTLTTTGNINVGSNYFVGNGFYLTGLDAAGQIANGTSNIRIPTAGANITFTVNGTTAANITSSGFVLLGTGNITAGNVYANAGTIGASALTGTLSTANQYNVTNVGTLGNLAVTTNITSGNIYANSGIVKGQYLYGDGSNLTGLGGAGYIFNGTSNVFIATSGGNVSFTVGGFTNILTVTTTGANIGGYANITGNLAVVGNITSGNANLGNAATANYFIGNLYGNANSANTVINATQSNITSVGTLTSLTVSGITNLGSVSNVRVTGGSSGQYLATDGAGNLSWGTPSGGGGSGTSLTYTAATTPPGTANIADQWFNTTANVLYEYINDGSASYWVDISSPSFATTPGTGGTTTTADTISPFLLMGA